MPTQQTRFYETFLKVAKNVQQLNYYKISARTEILKQQYTTNTQGDIPLY